MQRYLSIDILRGLAIVLMIQVHFVDNLSPSESSYWWLYNTATFFGSFPAPFFAFVSGLSYSLWIRKQESMRRRDREITRTAAGRGLFLFVIGIAFNFFIWLPEETFNWDILTLLGTSLLFLAVARKLPLAALSLMCVAVLLVSPVLRIVSDFSAYWEDHAYTYDFTFRDISLGFVANGYFPVFPWIIFPIVGFICGEVVFRPRPADAALGWLCAVGIGLLALSASGIVFGATLPPLISQYHAEGLSEFPASTEFVLAMVGCTLLSLALLHRWIDRKAEVHHPGRFIATISRYSAFSLTVYVLHHMVILWPLWIYGAWMNQEDPTAYWRQAMSPPLALLFAAVFFLACHFVLLFLEKHRGFSLESLMRRICG